MTGTHVQASRTLLDEEASEPVGNGAGQSMPGETLGVIASISEAVAEEISALGPIYQEGGVKPDPSAEEARAESVIWRYIQDRERSFLRGDAKSDLGTDRQLVFEAVKSRLFGLSGFETYLRDPSVENLFMIGADQLFVTRSDCDHPVRLPALLADDHELVQLLNRWSRRLGRTERRFDVANPRLDLILPGGFRLHAIMEVTRRPVVTIRCPYNKRIRLSDLVEFGSFDSVVADFLRSAVKGRLNIVVAGGTGSGKTTMLKALLREVDPSERIITIEDTAELNVREYPEEHPTSVEMETRDANSEGVGEMDMRTLTRECLRMSPDRVVLGEVRGAEALYMLKAMGQGNDGSMCTIHAESAEGAVDRIRGYVAEGSSGLSTEVIDGFVRNAIDLIIHLSHQRDGHRVLTAIVEVQRDSGPGVSFNRLFVGQSKGNFERTGAASSRLKAKLEVYP